VTIWQALLLGLLQGLTELFPVSSLGHAVVVTAFFHSSYRPADATFVPFLALLHMGTAVALLVLYRSDWRRIALGFFRSALHGEMRGPDERLAMLLVAATIPTGLIGFFLESRIKALFASPALAGGFLLLNGLMLLGAELLRRRDERRARLAGKSREQQEAAYIELENMSFRAAGLIGVCQVLSLLPGISRSGITMAGGLLAGLRHQEAARFSFLLATPIIAAAGVLEIPQLFGPGVPLAAFSAGAVAAGLAAYASARFLVRYFRVGRLDPYAYYCGALGLISLALLR
jgi:undecaprenyl-diphosphatase